MVKKSKIPTKFALIDDDPLIHATWSMVAKNKGHELTCFDSLDTFKKASLPSDTPIFVDYQLGSQKGTEVAKCLTAMGHKTIFITTGQQKEDIPTLPEISGIIGKTYPY